MEKIRISAVKYANTYPFIWGLRESGFDRRAVLETDHPADCATKLISGRADVGLIPAGALPLIENHIIISDYCISSAGKVRTVMLLCNCRFEEIEIINLDYRSVSSVSLTRILAKNMWNREFVWKSTTSESDFGHIGKKEAVVLIGDQCFQLTPLFRSRIDLAEEWKKFTGLPFVFACWAANREIDIDFISDFNKALKYGIDNIDKVVEAFSNNSVIKGEELKDYLTHNIDFILDDEKKKGMKLFLDMLDKL